MTRKKYRNLATNLVVAIWKNSDFKNKKIGEHIRYTREHVYKAIAAHGSYQKAWDNLKDIREMYGLD